MICKNEKDTGTHLEGGVEVLHIDVLVGSGLPLAPEQQAFLGRHLLHADVWGEIITIQLDIQAI